MSYQPPTDIWEVSEQLKFDEPLEATDPRFVETEQARGNFSFDALYRRLGVDARSLELKVERKGSSYILFCGHRGCGKSTELRRVKHTLDKPDIFCTLFMDAASQLDTNNLQYADVLFALTQRLLDRLEQENVAVDAVFLTRLENWFKDRIESHTSTKDFALEVKAGVEAQTGVPFLSKLFAKITNSFKVNSTYKEELRQVLKNSFTEFAGAFNQLIVEAEAKLKALGKGRKLLFLVDGTDRLSGEDSRRFFVEDVHQLQLIEGLFVYCAPIHLIYQDNQINQSFDLIFKLPMIKLSDKGSIVPLDEGYEAMREMIYRRADRSLFDSTATVDYLIRNSGGHPRDLLRLLSYAFDFANDDRFDERAARGAVKQLATDYRRILDLEDYRLLREIDHAPIARAANSERTQRLLYNLALLEYNAFWWQSHPVVRTLPGYEEAARDPADNET